MDKQYTMQRDGKTYVLYGGLLKWGHERGLLSIETALLQVPTEANGNVAIVQATVRMADQEGVTRTFQGLGDAAPNNVNRMMAVHLIRMAETRAKARALRDAVNVGEALADDPTDDDEREPAAAAQAARKRPPRPPAADGEGELRAVALRESPDPDAAEADRLKKAQDYYAQLCREAMEQGQEYLPLAQLRGLDAIAAAGRELRDRLQRR